MKKILLVALAATAMVSCSQNDEFENESSKAEIKFSTVVKAGTKASVVTTDNFEKFTVNGYKTDGDMGDQVQLTDGFMDDAGLTKSGNAWNFDDNAKFYWPLTGKVQFFATSPARTLDISSAGYPKFAYTINPEASQEDLIAANVINQTKTGSAISLPFKHLLTQVNFSIKGKEAGFIYTVTNLKISGAMDKADFTFNGTETVGNWGTPTASTADLAYEYKGNAVSVTTTADNLNTVTANFEETGKALFILMPQELTNVNLDITYTAAPSDKPTEYTYNSTKTVKLTGKWEMGKNVRYTLTLSNDASPITFDPNINSTWVDEAGTFN